MESITCFLLLSFVWTCIHVLTSKVIRRKPCRPARLPPGPTPFPVIGNLLSLGSRPHVSLTNLSKTYGPLMSLKLGSMTTIVVSSPRMAKEVLQKHDHALSGRTVPDSVHALHHHKLSLAWQPATDQRWRSLKKLYKEHLFGMHRLDATQALRLKKVQELVDYVHHRSKRGEAVAIGAAASTTSLNLLSNTIFSIDLAHFGSDLSFQFKDSMCALMEIVAKPNLADYFPVLKWIDPQSTRQRTRFYFEKIMAIFEDILVQRLQAKANSSKLAAGGGGGDDDDDDFLGVLLNLSQENDNDYLSRNHIKHLLMELFVGGTDTTSISVEWAMTELLRSPEIMARARAEVRDVIGKNNRVEELDIPRLPYLQAVVKETFRLHPPSSFLLPHKAESEVQICGFTVPKNSQILVNAWGLGRDSTTWPNPNLFKPERFLELDIDVKGQDFELIPFGAGRRMCPGLALGYRMVHLMLASLLHSFDWKLEEGLKPEDVDVSEKFGLALQKANPLKAIPVEL